MDPLAAEFLKAGILGAIIVAEAVFVMIQRRENRDLRAELAESWSKRTADAQAVTKTLLDLNKEWSGTLGAVTQTLEAQRELLAEVRDTIRSLDAPRRGR